MIRDSRASRSLRWLLLLLVGVALSGIFFVPSRNLSPSRSGERFPCENCPCGCATAEFCWDRCCCHTDREKLAWAKRNGVTPPAFLMARVSNASRLVAQDAKPACCHCACQQSHQAPKNSLEIAVKDDSVDDPGSTKIILMWKAAECRGMTYLWTLLADVYVAPSYQAVQIELPRLGRIDVLDERADSRSTGPDPPVPLPGCTEQLQLPV